VPRKFPADTLGLPSLALVLRSFNVPEHVDVLERGIMLYWLRSPWANPAGFAAEFAQIVSIYDIIKGSSSHLFSCRHDLFRSRVFCRSVVRSRLSIIVDTVKTLSVATRGFGRPVEC
jgi:hypothetical protein